MAYLAIYRKYRPRTFNEVVGQDYITQILKNQILSDRIGHAYLFSGIRGTGKTSIAKIFARAVNCVCNTDGNPCNECDVCREIDNPGLMDIIEIDAASNRGVDEIRDIRESVKYPPKLGKYKVYIIDEVHMMTKEAFNALLKTLEEPPKHAVFILATTEPNKLPATILSRCQRYEIKPISREKIVEQMQYITDDLNVRIEPAALEVIARRGDHSMRDSLSILDQIIDIRREDAVITEKDVIAFLGLSDDEALRDLTSALIDQNADAVITLLSEAKHKGIDNLLLMNQIIDYLRDLLIVKMTDDRAGDILGLSSNELSERQNLCETVEAQQVFAMIDSLIADRQKLRYNNLATVILEMALLKLCMPKDAQIPTPQLMPSEQSLNKIVKRTAPTAVKENPSIQAEPVTTNPQSRQAADKPTIEADFTATPEATQAPIIETSENKDPAESSARTIDVDKIFRTMHNSLGPMFSQFLLRGKLKQIGENKLALEFSEDDGPAHDFLKNQKSRLAEIVKQLAGNDISFDLKLNKNEWEQMSFEEKSRAYADALGVSLRE